MAVQRRLLEKVKMQSVTIPTVTQLKCSVPLQNWVLHLNMGGGQLNQRHPVRREDLRSHSLVSLLRIFRLGQHHMVPIHQVWSLI